MRRGQRGVTLLELLIAVSLVSLLSVGILMAMRVGLNAMSKSNARLMYNRRVIGANRVLEQQVMNFMPVTAECMTDTGVPGVKVPFFQGEMEQMRFASTYSLDEAARGYPRILEYKIIPGDQGKGVRIVVNERLYSNSKGAGMLCNGVRPDPELGVPMTVYRPIEVGPGSFVIADKLAAARFLYREPMPAPINEKWVPRWVRGEIWPTAIRIEMIPLEPDPGSLRMTSMTLPVKINGQPMRVYGD